MTTVYISKKSEISAEMEYWQRIGCKAYRTRIACNCLQHNTRYGAIIIDIDGVHIMSVVRCKACAKFSEGVTLSETLTKNMKGGIHVTV